MAKSRTSTVVFVLLGVLVLLAVVLHTNSGALGGFMDGLRRMHGR